MKFRGRPRLASALGRLAFDTWIRTGELDAGEAIVPVPLHRRRRRERGFNQAELLGKVIAKAAGKPCCRALVKVVSRPPQAGLSAAERLKNAAGAYRARLPARFVGKRLLLVDDVFTTGATVESCALRLLRAGARSVDVLTVARVP
ncbi:MAG: ComF family protein [Vicinamibacteria bacterium]